MSQREAVVAADEAAQPSDAQPICTAPAATNTAASAPAAEGLPASAVAATAPLPAATLAAPVAGLAVPTTVTALASTPTPTAVVSSAPPAAVVAPAAVSFSAPAAVSAAAPATVSAALPSSAALASAGGSVHLALAGSVHPAAWSISQHFPNPPQNMDQLKAQLQSIVQQLDLVPSICRRGEPLQVVRGVADWSSVKKAKAAGARPYVWGHTGSDYRISELTQRRSKGPKAGGNAGRTYTSRFRGVHQTFPTRRWEAQFRRNGKPTSLGCFDKEEEAARAYDKMMLWCEIHAAGGIKGVTNFDLSEYEKDVGWLTSITQDELIEALRTEGRRQASHRSAGAGTKRGRSNDAVTDGDSDGGAAEAAAAAAVPASDLPSPGGLSSPAAAALGDGFSDLLQQQQQQQQQQEAAAQADAAVGAALAAAAALAGVGLPVDQQQQQQMAAADEQQQQQQGLEQTAPRQDDNHSLEADEVMTEADNLVDPAQLLSNPLLALQGVAGLSGGAAAAGADSAVNTAVMDIGQGTMAAIQQLQEQLDSAGGDPEAAAAAAFQIGQMAGSHLLAALGANPAVAAAAAAAAAAAGQAVPSSSAAAAAAVQPGGMRGGLLTPAAAGSSNCLTAAAGAKSEEAPAAAVVATGAGNSGLASGAASQDT